MNKGNSEPLSPELMAEMTLLEAMTNEEIDTADIPEETEWSGAVRGRFYRPVKKLRSVRLDADVIDWFKSSGGGYQTRINAALREYLESHKNRG
jgi:uncharacterized protein (DUF4415 family)